MGWRRFVIGGAAAAAVGAGFVAARSWYRTWGVDDEDAERALPGDDLVPGATTSDTRTIEIDAPPEAVWPWLIQMGYGRAGWYSYDMIDMKGTSAHSILPEFQSLEVGDVLPTHPGGGFAVRVVEPDHALVVYMDSALAESQAVAARSPGSGTAAAGTAAAGTADSGGTASGESSAGGTAADETPVNLQAAGSFMSGMRDFAASWAFVVEPTGDGRTRFIERMRASIGSMAGGPAASLYGGVFGFGVFVMMRRQMLGIRERVEGPAIEHP